jgi:DNA-binding NarL/FixJ family response regulator
MGSYRSRDSAPYPDTCSMHLPDMPGEQLLALLRAEPATHTIPVVVLSADATQHHIDQLHAAGVTAYLTKPIAVRDLLRALDQVLDQPPTIAHTEPSSAATIPITHRLLGRPDRHAPPDQSSRLPGSHCRVVRWMVAYPYGTRLCGSRPLSWG